MKNGKLYSFVVCAVMGAGAVCADNGTLGAMDKMNVDAISLAGPMSAVFDTPAQYNKFISNLFRKCEYVEQKNVFFVSAYELANVCVLTYSELNGGNSPSESQKDACTTFSINVVKKVVGVKKFKSDPVSPAKEKDEKGGAQNSKPAADNNSQNTPVVQTAPAQDDDAIYRLKVVLLTPQRRFFTQKLQLYIMKKYCVGTEGTGGTSYNASISCLPTPTLTCDKVANTQYLARDLDLMCNQSNWDVSRDKDSGKFIIQLKQP